MRDRAISKDDTISLLRVGAARLRRGVLWVIFGLILMIPKVNRLRRQKKLWNFIRVLVAFAGAGMLALGAFSGHSYALLAAGALMLLFALVMNAMGAHLSVDARARELGALIVVDGGSYIDSAGSRHRARLFLAPDRLWVLDSALQVLLEIPLEQIRSLSVRPAGIDWNLRIEGADTAAEFTYEGSFAEHLARVADAMVRSRLSHELPVFR
jgi:hypothetical protein